LLGKTDQMRGRSAGAPGAGLVRGRSKAREGPGSGHCEPTSVSTAGPGFSTVKETPGRRNTPVSGATR
jgi:hypothetical protein